MPDLRLSFGRPAAVLVALVALALLAGVASADEDGAVTTDAAPAAAGEQAQDNGARDYFTDVELVNQHGETMRLYSDLLRGRTVVINPFFTTCTGVCPMLSERMAAIQERFADRLGEDLYLMSISVDPEVDTPQSMAAYATRFEAKPGWFFLGGDKANVDLALKKLGQYVADKEAHSNILIIGNEVTGLWKKAFGLGPAPALLSIVESVLDDPGAD